MAYCSTIFHNPSSVLLIEWFQISFPERIHWHSKAPFLAVKLDKRAGDYTNRRFSSGKTQTARFCVYIYVCIYIYTQKRYVW